MIMGNGIPAPALGNGEKIQDGLPGDGKLNQPTPMASPDWHQVEEAKPTMEDFTAEDWTLLSRQKKDFYSEHQAEQALGFLRTCLLYTSPSPRDGLLSRMPSSA